ncbi:MAG: pantoate--beta-alanine ligase [Saprospiraceae bacterium]|nr:pantoate--beta-alanine ligase [Saprospiraceae bacterium]
MHVFTTVSQIQSFLDHARSQHNYISFVPTLGALHQGHLQLMEHARAIGDIVVASIFVNPTQFNDPSDLEKYPRPLRSDIHKLSTNGVDVLFLPMDEEVYPPGLDLKVSADLTGLTDVMEGPSRPGHFEGVVTVVKRLLDIVQPDALIMGQKDYQQQAIIAEMIRQLAIPTKLIRHEIVRDKDGLALSSRNARIDPALRPVANTLYKALLQAKELYLTSDIGDVIDICSGMILDQGFKLEYFTIIDGTTLQPIHHWEHHDSIVVCVAAWLGEVRLIDNKIIYPNKSSIPES